MQRIGKWCVGMAVVALATSIGAGQQRTEQPLDNDFLAKIAACNHAEVEIGKLAATRASSEKVKDFAQNLVKEHQKVHERVADLMKNRKIAMLTGLDKDGQAQVQKLTKLEGKEFDRTFLNDAITEHRTAITLFENQIKNGKDKDISTFAQETLPALQNHMKRAEELAKTADK